MTFLRSYFWILLLAGWITAVGFLTSAAVTALGARYLIDDSSIQKLPAEVERQLAVMASQAPKKGAKDASDGNLEIKSEEILLATNLFCPTCKPEEIEEEPEADDGPEEPVEDPDELTPSALPYALAATMEADRPKYSIAVMVHNETRATTPVSPGDELEENVVIESVGRARVIFRNNGKREFIDVNGTPPPPPKKKKTERATPKKNKKPKKRRNPREIEGAADAIDCKGNTCTVDKSFRDKIIANPALLAKQARVIPAIRDGETRGFKFYGIRNGSLPKLLGVKNGDLITSINGSQLRNYDEVLGLYNKLRRANHITVGIERNGKQVTKEVNFR